MNKDKRAGRWGKGEFKGKWVLIFQTKVKIDLSERTCPKTFNFQKHCLLKWMKLAKNIKKLPYARNILKNSEVLTLVILCLKHFLPLDSLDKLPSCGFDIYFLSTQVGS